MLCIIRVSFLHLKQHDHNTPCVISTRLKVCLSCRYYCSFFGNLPFSVIVKPPVSLQRHGEELHFCHSSNSIEVNAVYEELVQHALQNPLTVELWESCDDSYDCIVGSAQV